MRNLLNFTFILLILVLVACGIPSSVTGTQPASSFINVKPGDAAKTTNWAIAVTGSRDARRSLSFTFAIKNTSNSTQVLDTSRIVPTLLDEHGYIVSRGQIDFAESIISVPRGLKLNFEASFSPASSGGMPKFSQIGIAPDFVGVSITFDPPTAQNPNIASDDIPTTIGNATAFGTLQVRVLGVNGSVIDLGIENNSSTGANISWGFYSQGTTLIKAMTIDDEGNIVDSGSGIRIGIVPNPIPANSKVKWNITTISSTAYTKFLLYDQSGNAALFKIR